MRCIPVDKCIRWIDSKSIQLSCKYAEAFLKVQITCFYISHLPPTQPPCSWLTLLGNLVDDDLMTYEHTPPSQRLLQPACTRLRWQGPQGTAHWMHMTVWTPSPLLPFPSSRHSEEVFSSSHTAPPTPLTRAQKQWHGPEKNQHQSEHDSLLWDKIMQLAIWSLLHILPSPQKHLVASAKHTHVQQALFFFFGEMNKKHSMVPGLTVSEDRKLSGHWGPGATLPHMEHRLLSDCQVQDQLCPYWCGLLQVPQPAFPFPNE